MNSLMVKTLDTYGNKFNKEVTDGNAEEILERAQVYLDSIFRDSIKSLSKDVNLKYIGCRRITPEEEFYKLIKPTDTKVDYDISKSDVYVIEFKFEYNGEPISRYIYLPFATRGNIMYISNTPYYISPVLSDTVISPNHREVFIRLLKDKLIFKSLERTYIKNGHKVLGYIIHAEILKTISRDQDTVTRPCTPVSLYIAGQHGLRAAFYKYAKIDNVILVNDLTDEIRENYNVYGSSNIRPKNIKACGYVGHNLKICIHKSIEPTQFMENFIYGLIYALDYYPDITDELLAAYNSNNTEYEILAWRKVMGKINYNRGLDEIRLLNNIEDHYTVLQGYMDSLIKNKLAENNYIVEDFFDLLALLLSKYNTWLRDNKEFTSTIDNRYIDILYYILYDIIISFNKVILGINKRATKVKNIQYKEINKVLINEFSSRKIFNLIKSTEPALCVKLAECSSDILYPKLTSVLEDQWRGNGVKRGKNNKFPQYTKQLKGGDLYLGSLLFLTKTAPTPRLRCNAYLQYDNESGRLLVPPELRPVIEKVNDLLLGRTNEKIDVLDIDLID